jgi:hypothetical protein
VRTVTGDYLLAFLASGLACLMASFLLMPIVYPRLIPAAAE